MKRTRRPAQSSGFDKLAGVYRWLEYATFGPLLQRTRVQFVPALHGAQRVLVLGDGDGRFCAQLLRHLPQARVVAVDTSEAMLLRMETRAKQSGVQQRLTTVHTDARETLPPGPFHAVCTHFFLDCLAQGEVAGLVERVRRQYAPADWLISEFAIPPGAARWPAWLVVRALYAAFRLLTGLRTQHLPDHAAVLRSNGFALRKCHTRIFGLLRAECWQAADALPGRFVTATLHPIATEMNDA